MIPFFLNVLRLIAPALVAWGASEKGDVIVSAVPESIRAKVPAWAWPFIIMFVIGAAVFLIMKFVFKGKGRKGGMFLLALSACVADYFLGVPSDVMLATVLVPALTTGAAVVTSANLQFLPERISYAVGTQLTGIKITVQGDGVVFDSDANGLTHMGVNRVIGQVTNNYVFTLANGLIKNKNVLFEFTNSAAQTPAIYFDSDSQDANPLFLQMMKVSVLIGGNDFSDFATLALPSLAATDSITILYNDGTVQANMTRADLQYKLGFIQAIVNTPIYFIDNYDQRIKSVSINAAAAQTGYMQRFVPSLSGAMVAGQI
jgi:hypothetical protein